MERVGDRSRWFLPAFRSRHGPGDDRAGERGPLFDPNATQLWFGPDHRRDQPDIWAVDRAWPEPRPQRHTTRPLVVYEAHVRGTTKRRDRPDAGTFAAFTDELPRLRDLGISVVELLPVHQFDPAEHNYWGYMPLVFGAVHQRYANDPARAPEELADFVAAAHEHDIEVWLDVVFNHTSEEDESGPTHHLRELGRRPDGSHGYYVTDDDGRWADEAGTGNTIDTHSDAVRELIVTALDRLADLGVDGFRFDLATILARNPGFVRGIGDWGERRGVRLIAEAWDVVRYQVGPGWPDQRWMQWNGPYRDDLRGVLRGEPGLVWTLMRRISGSPDLFDRPSASVNFLTAHDGFTMYDLVSYDRKHNEANGHDNTDGTDDNRSWNCGFEGDADDDGPVPDEVMGLRRRQLRNAFTLLMLSAGVPMCVAGDEFARTQGGNNNAYNQDNEISWIDWGRRDDWAGLEEFVRHVVELRAATRSLTAGERPAIDWFGADGEPDVSHHSRSLAWRVDDLYVLVNAWWEPLDFRVQVPGVWRTVVDTTDERGGVDGSDVFHVLDDRVSVGPRSIVVLRR